MNNSDQIEMMLLSDKPDHDFVRGGLHDFTAEILPKRVSCTFHQMLKLRADCILWFHRVPSLLY